MSELNAAIKEKLYIFNHKPFQKKDGSRAILFVATVQYNYHIGVDNQNYSVPYEYIKQKVDVRITKNVIEVFFDGNRICSHPRLYGRRGQNGTFEVHMPPNHDEWRTV